MKRLILPLSAAALLAGPAWAESSDILILGNSDRGVLQRLTGGGDLSGLRGAFEERGAEVSLATDADAETMREAFRDFVGGLDAGTEDVVIVLTGRFVSTVAGSYLLPEDSSDDPALADVLIEGFPLDAVYAVAANYPGRALIVLGETDQEGDLAPGLSVELPLGEVPQGVTIAIGPAGNAAEFTAQLADATGADVLPLARAEGLSLKGFVPRELPMLDAEVTDLPQVTDDGATQANAEADVAAWEEAQGADTQAAYETYLAAFPEGSKAAEARQRLATIKSEPFYREKRAEEALGLSRDARREIQRDLALLGYNTRGIDGIFGRGTRAAVTAWQEENDAQATGYLTANQISRLDAQAERRAAELEEEARQRQAELERQDRTFWEETGAKGDEAGYRAYLKRYPDGQYAEAAQERLNAIEARRRAEAEDQDATRWQQARQQDTQDAYRAYLNERPNGAFVEEARARIDWLERNAAQSAEQAQAEAEEAALNLNPAARRLAEARLESLGLEPGAVDGRFDEDSRRAIRRYQEARELRVTGYLDQPTVVRLLADTLLR
ncbi:peptidoglycan-binding protein [Marivita sp. GX14005]|uniref:peptidoglycan-binding domain-containing protein n=1 Tax=Marivita sp. GX14005 TaxID=2942276 RepID=UPI002018FB44|nr:peptidoglycan-binding protein [Marivita sp. GX14005]MCL3881993.1 peptidoglycan-binding protein [Marivita sp. GX14005]